MASDEKQDHSLHQRGFITTAREKKQHKNQTASINNWLCEHLCVLNTVA